LQSSNNKEKQREASKKIERNTAKAQQKGAGKGGKNKGMMLDDDSNDATAKPKKWNDYQVKFTFPQPANSSETDLLQLLDAHFKYPGRDDFAMHDMNIGLGMGSRVRAFSTSCAP
jgi:ATP-binding cassette, subfamily F, member 1